MSKILLLGCGHKTEPEFHLADLFPDSKFDKNYEKIVRLDNNPNVKPDILEDLRATFEDKEYFFEGGPYDEIHAYEVMEHFGDQGDYEQFFDTMNAIARSLKPGGHFITSSPRHDSPWLWGDPGHTRAVLPETYVFLYENTYDVPGRPATDYRGLIEYWWEPVGLAERIREGHAYLLAIRRL